MAGPTVLKTITLYVDGRAFRNALVLPNESIIHRPAVDRSGNVLCREQGPLSPAKTQSVVRMLGELLKSAEAPA